MTPSGAAALVAALVIGAASFAVPARAAPADDAATRAAKAAFDEGKAHYELARFSDARAAFERAWTHKRLPELLFNIGQCHFQERRFDRAIFFYESYLEMTPKADNRALVLELIEEAKAQLPPPSEPSFIDEARYAIEDALAPSTLPRPDDEPRLKRTNRGSGRNSARGSASATRDAVDDAPSPWLWAGVAAGTVVVVAAGAAVAWAFVGGPPPTSLGTLDRSR